MRHLHSGCFGLRGGVGPVVVIASSAGVASFAMNFWIPFIPLYMKELGATSDANALFWVGVALTSQGIARLLSGPVWGMLSDRVGRKVMFVRALYFATATTAIAAFATAPWHVAVAFFCQGLFSGFVPAAVALTSVIEADEKLSTSLGLVTGAQYLGNTVGPAIGALLAITFGYHGAILAAAVMPAISATVVLVTVPRDHVSRVAPPPASGGGGEARTGFWRSFGFQFYFAMTLYFFFFAMTQLIRTVTPIAIGAIAGDGRIEGLAGIAFTVSGVASLIGVLVVGRRYVVPGRFAIALSIGCVAIAVAHVALALSPNVTLFIAAFSVIALVQAALLPATNTLIASSVERNRRGTAFGLASSAQALAFMTGPLGAAFFVAVSLRSGFLLVAALFVVVAGFILVRLKEPHLRGEMEPATRAPA